MQSIPVQRVMAYVDGFNLYHGMKDSKIRHCRWLNLDCLVRRLLREGELVGVKYFTARIKGLDSSKADAQMVKDQEAKRIRQTRYLDALATVETITIYEGQSVSQKVICRECKSKWTKASEKMTDVNIATQMLVDAFANVYDTALLISADSDLVPPIRAIKELFRDKKMVVAFPPRRKSYELQKMADINFSIGQKQIEESQFPGVVVTKAGHEIQKPVGW